MKRVSTLKICLTSLFAAMICVATMLVQISIPATGGYANLGDGIILISAFLMNPIYSVIAAGLGSMLADLMTGYVTFAPGTLIVKAGVALIAAAIYGKLNRKNSVGASLAAMIVAGVIAETFMVFGYFFYEAVLLGVGIGAVGGILGNVGQGVVGVIVACVVTPVLNRSAEVRELMDKTQK